MSVYIIYTQYVGVQTAYFSLKICILVKKNVAVLPCTDTYTCLPPLGLQVKGNDHVTCPSVWCHHTNQFDKKAMKHFIMKNQLIYQHKFCGFFVFLEDDAVSAVYVQKAFNDNING